MSWVRAIQFHTTSMNVMTTLEAEIEAMTLQNDQSWKLLKETRKSRDALSKQFKKLKRTKHLLSHELKMIEELYEADESSNGTLQEIPPETLAKFKNRKSAGVKSEWVQHRQETLLHKIYHLQAVVQNESKQRVLQKYGPGPYMVHFNVLSNEGRKPGDFVVELAPLDAMPHSIEAFLDMVEDKMWDNSVFYHHRTQGHVVAAAPVSYGTFQSKQHLFESMGYTGVSFPEYSSKFPHEKYTIGFAGNGPNFYINTMDNTDHHGPGGQGHHDLATDADPCFGRVISGVDVIEKDMRIGKHQGRNPTGWQDFDLSRIASIRLMK
jgi:cyclophilin family peptidyl-prolyl cis-trans isomerase